VARNLAPLPMGVDHAVAAGAVISGLTAWQPLFDHGHLLAGQTVLIHGARAASARSLCSSPVRSAPG
jgi:NADPH:quinone reductase-like Zn-dependent oxidoreductase